MLPKIIEIPDSDVILRLFSPLFDMSYPEISNPERIPESTLQAMEASWKVSTFHEREITFSVLRNVYVVEEGLVFNEAGELYSSSITQHAPAEIERGHLAVCAAIADNSSASIQGTSVLCKKRGAENYGHWIMEMFPKAYLSKTYFRNKDLNYIVSLYSGLMKNVVESSMALLGIDEELLRCVGQEPVKFSSIVVVDGLSHHGVFMSPLIVNSTDHISAKISGDGNERLFVTRPGNTVRKLVDNEKICAIAQSRGYRLVDPGSMTFEDQIKTFKNARHIVGVMGAAMTNIVFAPQNTRIVNIAPANMPDTFFWFIAGIKRQSYHEVRCAHSGPQTGMAEWDTDIVLEDADLDRVLI